VRFVAALLLVLGLAAAAAAQEAFVPGSARAEIETAVRAGKPERAVAYLQSLVADGAPRDRRRHVEAARAAMALLPPDVSAPFAVRLLAEALRMDPGDADGAWTAAQELRKDLRRRMDVENGERLLGKLLEIYPEVPNYRYELGYLLWGAGRREDARRVFETLHRLSPSDPSSAWRLAEMAEDDGDAARAVSYYDAVLRARPHELTAHQLKAVLLSASLGDHVAALAELDRGVLAAEKVPSGPERERALRRFAEERVRIESAKARREALRDLRDRTDRIVVACVAAWVAIAAGAAFAVRRLRPLPASEGLPQT